MAAQSRGSSRGRRPNPKSARTYHAPRRPSLGGEQIEGRRAVLELLLARSRKTREIWFDEDLERSGIVSEIASLALQRAIPVVSVSRGRFERTVASDASQGVIAFAEGVNDLTLKDLVGARTSPAKVVVLDHISDPRNLGAILRSAECAGFDGAVIAERRSTKITPTVTKSAAGAVEYLRFSLVPGVPAALEELKALGLWIVGLDPGGSDTIYNLELLSEPVALVLGSEGKGLSRLTRERCDALVSIPQFGNVESLNVAAAATVAFFEVARRRGES